MCQYKCLTWFVPMFSTCLCLTDCGLSDVGNTCVLPDKKSFIYPAARAGGAVAVDPCRRMCQCG